MSGNKARHTRSKIIQECRIRASPRGNPLADFLSFADLVVIAKEFYPIPFRTRPSKPSASMVLRLKPRESRTLPGLPRTEKQETRPNDSENPGHESDRGFCFQARCPGLTPPTQFTRSPVREIARGFLFFSRLVLAIEQRRQVGREQLSQHEIRQQILRKALGHIVLAQHM